MTVAETLKEAIENHKPISYQYIKPGKPAGVRYGNPYAVYTFTAKDGRQSAKVHIVQTAGVSETEFKQPFPSFRTHDLEEISDVHILTDELPFVANHPSFNPEWPHYQGAYALVS